MVHVRTGGDVREIAPGALVVEGGTDTVSATTPIARSARGPFAPVAVALELDGALRDLFSRAIPVPSLTAWVRVRWIVLAMAAPSLALLLELDRELVSKGLLGPGRMLVDVLVAAYVVFEITRRTPRLPAVAGAALLAVAMRWLLVVARSCGENVHFAVWGAAALSVVAGFVVLVRAPSRARVALEIMGKLGISRADAVAAKEAPQPHDALLIGAIAAAAGLPLLLWALRKAGASVSIQSVAFVAFAVVVPELVTRTLDGGAKPPGKVLVVRTLGAIAVGLAITGALLYGAKQFFDAGGEVARCVGRLDAESRRLLAAEAAEIAKRLANVRASTVLVVVTTVVVPFAEERVYRGLLMNVLVRKYGMAYGLFASSLAFGVAHVGVYEIALYQTVLLGVGFGVAYAEGGIVAAFVVHAAWNLLNVA
ncbi:MAG: CPBP family intramembrane metalloprotease [Labilithrix sp.]|nr:CPBP family intramembrane metalloprotease [Labilithrix sp.]